jgi:peptidyl-prolyl cis-trans isomerase SurA
MSNSQLQFGRSITSRFQMQDLPPEVAKVVDTMQVGQISKPFQMINQKEKTVCVIAKLKSRVDGHRANISDDYQVLKEVVLNKRREEFLHKWVVDKIKGVYTRLNDNYRDCKFEYEGWIK